MPAALHARGTLCPLADAGRALLLPTALVAFSVACGAPDEAHDPTPEQAGVGDTQAAPSFSCDARVAPTAAPLRRLTMTQYRNTVRDLVQWAVGSPTDATAILANVPLDELPEDRRESYAGSPTGSYRRLDQTLQQSHVDATYRVASAVAAALTRAERLASVVGACAVDAEQDNDASCLAAFIARFGSRALRHRLAPDEVEFYASVYGADPTALPSAYARVISVLLSSPHFLYFVEPGTTEVPGQPGTYLLSAHELASRLSYHFWQTAPDDALWLAADDGTLLLPDVYAAQVDRLMNDVRTQQTMNEFFEDWLDLEGLPALDSQVGEPIYRAFAGADLPTPQLRREMIQEILDLVAEVTWPRAGGLAELLTTDLSVTRSPSLARLYGVPAWDGVSEAPSMPTAERPGLLTRALFLATGSSVTRPIDRGVFIRRHILCDDLPPPPANVGVLLADSEDSRTTRERVTSLTEQPGTACAGCHATLINPLGFAFENFDALGRLRSEQQFFGPEGQILGSHPVNTETVPRVTASDERTSSGPADVVRLILESGKAEACVVRQYFRFASGRLEDLKRDGCSLEQLRTRLLESGRLADMLREVAFTPEFRQRTVSSESEGP